MRDLQECKEEIFRRRDEKLRKRRRRRKALSGCCVFVLLTGILLGGLIPKLGHKGAGKGAIELGQPETFVAQGETWVEQGVEPGVVAGGGEIPFATEPMEATSLSPGSDITGDPSQAVAGGKIPFATEPMEATSLSPGSYIAGDPSQAVAGVTVTGTGEFAPFRKEVLGEALALELLDFLQDICSRNDGSREAVDAEPPQEDSYDGGELTTPAQAPKDGYLITVTCLEGERCSYFLWEGLLENTRSGECSLLTFSEAETLRVRLELPNEGKEIDPDEEE